MEVYLYFGAMGDVKLDRDVLLVRDGGRWFYIGQCVAFCFDGGNLKRFAMVSKALAS